MTETDAFPTFAIELAARAAKVTLAAFRRQITAEDKGGGVFDPVTEADRQAEATIRRAVSERFPHHGLIGEEYGEDRPGAEWVWVVDPIDGTRAFIAGLPLWTTLVALLHDGQPVLGLVAQPYLAEVFIGDPSGARLVRSGEPDRTLSTRACAALRDATVATTDPDLFDDDEAAVWTRLRRAARLTRLGCDGYAYAMVAAGHIDLVAETGLKLWDWAGHKPLIEAAGGAVVGWDGRAVSCGRVLAVGDPRLLPQALPYLMEVEVPPTVPPAPRGAAS